MLVACDTPSQRALCHRFRNGLRLPAVRSSSTWLFPYLPMRGGWGGISFCPSSSRDAQRVKQGRRCEQHLERRWECTKGTVDGVALELPEKRLVRHPGASSLWLLPAPQPPGSPTGAVVHAGPGITACLQAPGAQRSLLWAVTPSVGTAAGSQRGSAASPSTPAGTWPDTPSQPASQPAPGTARPRRLGVPESGMPRHRSKAEGELTPHLLFT